jgi:hypothetical protein
MPRPTASFVTSTLPVKARIERRESGSIFPVGSLHLRGVALPAPGFSNLAHRGSVSAGDAYRVDGRAVRGCHPDALFTSASGGLGPETELMIL